MRVAILLASGHQQDIEYKTRDDMRELMVGHDIGKVYALPVGASIDDALTDDLYHNVSRDLVDLLRHSKNQSLDVTLKLKDNFGHMLRLAQFAQRLYGAVNKDGYGNSSVIAEP